MIGLSLGSLKKRLYGAPWLIGSTFGALVMGLSIVISGIFPGPRSWHSRDGFVRATGCNEDGFLRDELILVSGGPLRRCQGGHPNQGWLRWRHRPTATDLLQLGETFLFYVFAVSLSVVKDC